MNPAHNLCCALRKNGAGTSLAYQGVCVPFTYGMHTAGCASYVRDESRDPK